MSFRSLINICLVLCTCSALSACVAPRNGGLQEVSDLPESWPGNTSSTEPAPAAWLATFEAPFLTAAVDQAVRENYNLKQQAIAVEQARIQEKLARADRLPSLNLSLSGQRFRPLGEVASISEQVDISATASFEIDLWGKLSDRQRQAQLNRAATEVRYISAERTLAANVVRASFNLISANQLQQVFNQRLDNLQQSLDVIEKGYRSGLNEALDVYLALNTVEQERANVANQRQISLEARTTLELLLAEYPSAEIAMNQALPELPVLPAVGLPADLLQRRPDIQAAWLDLLAADAELAVAHKNRFPTLDLTGSVRDADSAVSRLLNGGPLAFSAAASLFQPLFQGGRLKALEEQAALVVQQLEQRYLDVVFTSIAEVTNELSRSATLNDRFNAIVQAEVNASTALTLAFDQYQKGLVTFTTVLDAQRRAFDAQTAVVQLRNQRLQTRVALLLALGGHYQS
ncbi:MAG: efflux transporter outer membrane subunit [Pseudomonadaceae bacterium]|nr:efflux transporter outer membrane subunit [Pseudomonadaceae bacterium]